VARVMAGENCGRRQTTIKSRRKRQFAIFLRLFSRDAMLRENHVGDESKVAITGNYYTSWRNVHGTYAR